MLPCLDFTEVAANQSLVPPNETQQRRLFSIGVFFLTTNP